MFPLRITSSHAAVSSSIESMAREKAWAWHETLKQLNQARHRANRVCLGQQSSSKGQRTMNSCGTVVLVYNLWRVSVAVWILDDRDALRGNRHIVGSPYTSFRRKPTRYTVHNICSVFRRGRRTESLISMHDGCPLTSLRISSTKALSHENRTGVRGEPK